MNIMKTKAYRIGCNVKKEKTAKEAQGWAGRVWQKLSKFVTLDKDGILKDPNWPHLWEHKR